MMSAQSHKSKTDGKAACPPLLVFHKLLNRLSYGATNYSPARFDRLLLHLGDNGWPSTDVNDRAPGRGRGVVISFDDGYLHLADLLPDLIARFELHPLIFVPSGLIGRSNDWDYSHRWCPTPHLNEVALRRLAGLNATIGSHGVSHCDLTACSPTQLNREIKDSRHQLQDITGQPIDCISYPFGRCNQRVIESAADAGYQHGFTMDFPQPTDRALARGRYPVYGFDTPWSILQKLEHGPAYQIERFKAATVGRLSGGTVLLNWLRRRSA